MPVKLDPHNARKAEELFKGYLRQRELKFTPERKTILEAILGTDEHFEAEDLLLQLRQQGIRVGKATIYRTLPLMVDCGILRRIFFGDNRAHYEHSIGPTQHDHMVCKACGRIIEFDSSEVLELRRQLAERYEFQAGSHRFQIAGISMASIKSLRAENPIGIFLVLMRLGIR